MQLEIRFFQEHMVFTGREEKSWSINEEYSVFQFYSDTLTVVLSFFIVYILAMGLLVLLRTRCKKNIGF